MTEKKAGRNPIPDEKIEAARSQVIALARLGCTDPEIGSIVGMSENSIKKYLRTELSEGRNNMRASLRKAQIETAIRDHNPTMLIWLGKNYLGQREPKQNLEVSAAYNIERKVYHDNALKAGNEKVIDITSKEEEN